MKAQILRHFLYILAGIFLSTAAKAEPKNQWNPLFEGIDYQLLTRKLDHGVLRIHAVRVDLANSGISPSIYQTQEFNSDLAPSTSSEFIQNTDTEFVFSTKIDIEFIKSSSNIKEILTDLFENLAKESKTSEHYRSLIRNGIPSSVEKSERIARNAIGISEDKKTLYFVIVEGGPRYGFWFKDLISIGANVNELTQIMEELGADNAIQLNSNRNLSMAVKREEKNPLVLNLSIDERDKDGIALPTHFGIRARPLTRSNESILSYFASEKAKVFEYRRHLRENGLAKRACSLAKIACAVAPDKIDRPIIKLEDLTLVDRKYIGEAKGGVFRDRHDVVWFAKAGFQPVHEYIGAKLIHRLRPLQTPITKIVANTEKAKEFTSPLRKVLLASRHIISFESSSLRKPHVGHDHLVVDSEQLKVAMDWIGLGDRSEFNQGYIIGTAFLKAARIDFDNSFDDINGYFDWEYPEENMLKVLAQDLEKYSLDKLGSAVEILQSIPDQEIDIIVSNACKDLTDAGLVNPCLSAPFNRLSEMLIRRKIAAQTFASNYQYYKKGLIKNSKDSSTVHVVRINHNKMNIKLSETSDFDNPEKLSDIAKRTNAVIAINAGFWNFGKSIIPIKLRLFLSKKLGIHTYPAYPNNVLKTDNCQQLNNLMGPTLAWNLHEHAFYGAFTKTVPRNESISILEQCIAPPTGFLPPGSEIKYAVGFYPLLTTHGILEPNLDSYEDIRAKEAAPRTGVCIGNNHEWNLVVAEAASLEDFGKFMLGLQCSFAVNLDGGGSSSLVINQKRVFGGNDFFLSKERPISDALIVTQD